MIARIITRGAALALFSATTVYAQDHQHTAGMVHPTGADSTATRPPAGQAAFAAIADVVRQLEADPHTDWSRVNIERLRQHLLDMDAVVMRSRVTTTNVSGGAQFDVRGDATTAAAIKRMVASHAAMLGSESELQATVAPSADGVRFTVVSKTTNDARSVARIRGLGFAGLLTVGEHHAAHHLALARGDAMTGH